MRNRQPIYAALLAALFLATAALPGCGVVGDPPNVDSTADAVLEAKATAKAYALAVGDLLDAGVITRGQAAEQLGHLRRVQRQLEQTVDVIEATGDPLAAGDALERADSALALVVSFLADHEGEL